MSLEHAIEETTLTTLSTITATLSMLGTGRHDGASDPLVLLVTGASSGIGRETALLAAGRGHHLILAARRKEALAAVAAECDDRGAASTYVVVTDVGDDAQVARMVRSAVRRHGHVDAVLHCAGVVSYGRVEDTSAADFESVVRTNLLGAASVARHTVPLLRERGRGTLVLVGSLLGQIAVPEMTPYVVSKWGVRGLARQLVIENVDKPDVHICLVSPGSVDTPIYDSALDSGGAVHRPPPPSISAERVARVVLAQLGHRRTSVHTALSNYGMVAGFTLAPRVYDRVIGPIFQLVNRTGARR